MKRSKKGAMGLSDLAPIAIAFVFVAVVIGVGASLLASVQDDAVTNTANCGRNSTGGTSGTIGYSACGTNYNVTGEGLQSLGELSSWLPTIALVIAAAVVIGVLSYFRS